MKSSAEQIRTYTGPAIWSIGFRPFFLGGAICAALAVGLWLPMLSGHLVLPTAFTPVEWHMHELIFGYVPAVVAGFLLTAVPNWTGRLPVNGRRLQMLFLVWVIGRVAVLGSRLLGPHVAAVIDLMFLATLFAVILREIIAAKNTHNLKVIVIVGLLLAGNVTFHIEVLSGGRHAYGSRAGIAAAIMLIMLIGGRVIPSFTRNWLARRGAGRLPIPFGRFDAGVVLASALGLASWVYAPEHRTTAVLALVAAVLNVMRLARWAGERTGGEPLVAILHVAFAFVPIGFVLLSLGILRPDIILPSGALHGWTAGAIALMTLAVMTRTSLGHTGRPLAANGPIQFIYVAAVMAALFRIVAAFGVVRELTLYASAAAWIMAFSGYIFVYSPMLTRPKV
jgi:uncharacterized protein involved in response to NO